MKTTHAYILAVDCGSTNFKAAIFDNHLRRLGACDEPLRYKTRRLNQMEFSADAVWATTKKLIGRVCVQAGINLADIATIAITSQANTFCALDKDGCPLIPFMSWQDRRAAQEAECLNQRLHKNFHDHCSWPSMHAGNQAAMILWLKCHQPEIIRRASAFVNLPGFLLLRLGFQNFTDENLEAMSGLYSLQRESWWMECLQRCGIQAKQLPVLVALGQKLKIATHCPDPLLPNLSEAFLAGNDQTAGAFGNFCSRKNLILTLGTALVVYRFMGRRSGPYTAQGCWGPYPGGGSYELFHRNQGCAALDWARKRLTPKQDIMSFSELAKKMFARQHIVSYTVPSAFFYPDAVNTNQAWVGSSDTGVRALAVFEGIGFTVKYLMEEEMCLSALPTEICVIGGGSANLFWLQMLADILNLSVTQGTGDALRGAAMQACPNMVINNRNSLIKFQPRDFKTYQKRYEQWKLHMPPQGGK